LANAPDRIEWQFIPDSDRSLGQPKSNPNVDKPSSEIDTAVSSASGSTSFGRAIAGVQDALTAVGTVPSGMWLEFGVARSPVT
jgi:hypothetical protein